MRKSVKTRIGLVVLALVAAGALSGCSLIKGENQAGTAGNTSTANTAGTNTEKTGYIDTGFVLTGPEAYDSADTCLLVAKDTGNGKVTFLNLDLNKRYTLEYDGTTKCSDKFGQSLSMAQINIGQVVDVTFLKSKKHLTSIALCPDSWTFDNVERYEINEIRSEVSIGSMVYKMNSSTQFISEGQNIELMDINGGDVLTFTGLDSTILSITVEKGHGYLRLKNETAFVGGWIEVGNVAIREIEDNMLLTIPEGSYQVKISQGLGGGLKNVTIRRNEETTLDIGDLEIPEPQKGTVLFSLTPATAKLYIDGTKMDATLPISLEYGLHQLIVKADGYQSITQYIKVGQESAGFNIELEALKSDTDSSSSSSSTESTSATTTTATGNYSVYIDAPTGAEVYLDGNYVGISPCHFAKTYGAHVVTLRKTGYTTRSYSIALDDAAKDVSYSFADLDPISTSQ